MHLATEIMKMRTFALVGAAVFVSFVQAASLTPEDAGRKLVFDRDFRTREGDPSLDGFEIVRQYDGVGKDAIRFACGYGIAFPLRGNIHLVRMPGQRDCTVDGLLSCEPPF